MRRIPPEIRFENETLAKGCGGMLVITSSTLRARSRATGQQRARYLAACDGTAYLEAEERARRQRLGVWRVPGGITRPWDFRRGRRSARIPEGTTPDGSRHSCSQIGSHARAQELPRQGHSDLDSDGDGEACERLP